MKLLNNQKHTIMNRILQITFILLIISTTNCTTQVPVISQEEEKVINTEPEVSEVVESIKEEVTKEIILAEEPMPTATKPLSKNDRMDAVAVGNNAPKGIIYQRDSTQLSTESFKGKYTVIDFWATWCGPCVKEGPIFHKLGETYKDKNIQFVGVSVDRDFIRWNQFLQQRNWQGNNYWMGMAEEEAFFAFAYSEVEFEPGELGIIVGLPKYVIIGPDGDIVHNSSYIKPSNPKFMDLLNDLPLDKN